MNKVTLKRLFDELDFIEPINNYDEELIISEAEISRPGLELTGFTEHFLKNRIQVIGAQESSYLSTVDYNSSQLDEFFKLKFPLIVFSKNHYPDEEFINKCNKNNIALAISNNRSTKLQTLLYSYLEYELAAETQVHGVLLSVFGTGVLIQGASGIGKSELALELINRGHFLIADDAVVIRQTDDVTLIGSAPELLRNRLEIRGIGIVDIQKLYGVTKVIKSKKVELVIQLNQMSGSEDRIGTAVKTMEILDASLPKIEIPVSIGRTISNLIEVAVANFDLKKYYGYDSAEAFVSDLNNLLSKGEK